MYERVPDLAPCQPRAGVQWRHLRQQDQNSVDVSLSVDLSDAF